MKYLALFLVSAIAGVTNAQMFTTNQRIYDTIPFIPEHGASRIAKFEQEPIVTGKIMFLGNSITEGGNWAQLTGDNTIVNRGIGGDITYGMLRRLDDVIKRKPSKLFILIGINDIGKDIPDEAIANNYVKIIRRIQKESSDTKIFIQSILPVNPSVAGFPQHYAKPEHVVNTNILLQQIASIMKCTYIDLFSVFLDEKKYLDKNLTSDGLHLNSKGYERWVKHLKEKGYL